MKINEALIKRTTHCSYNFSCLIKNVFNPKKLNQCSGEIVKIITSDFSYVKCSAIFCFYNTHFGEETICKCPTRIEIFKKYSI